MKNQKHFSLAILLSLLSFLVLIILTVIFWYSSSYSDKTEISGKAINNNKKPAETSTPQKLKLEFDNKNKNFDRITNLNDRDSYLPFHPIKLKIIKDMIFYLDKGNLKYILNGNVFDANDEHKISKKELVNIVIENKEKPDNVYVFDKLNNIYSYSISKKLFKHIYKTKSLSDQPDPHFISATFDEKLYILDPARNQIWFLDNNNQIQPFFSKEIATWKIKKGDRDLSDGIDLYKEGNKIFVLKRSKMIDVYENEILIKTIAPKTSNSYGYLSFFSNKSLKDLYLVGGYNGNIVSISKADGKLKNIYNIENDSKNLPIYDVFIKNSKIFVLAGNSIIEKKNFNENNLHSNDNINSDLLENSLINKNIKDFEIPVKIDNPILPNHPSLFPGARRIYRHGIHEGIDFFEASEKKVYINEKTPVVAIKDGEIIRSDQNYQEMSIDERNKVLKECEIKLETSPENADKLRGRQVRIKHDGNIVSVYAHLSKIKENIYQGKKVKKGDILGYVGNSGTSDGVLKNKKDQHLHFEVHIDDESKNLEYYLGKYLSIEETMQIYTKIFQK